ncbi:RNA-binding domain-containing protein [Roseimarinus sediminis]|uniref:RNA-binding domain-containing protein n=1 Tax=Roseimarinus sediminis TaxID=1610899 RepID=UPI003D1E49BD
MILSEQIQKGESKTLELKEALPKNENIAKTVVAFSNTSGGKLIIGVNDQREITGIDDNELFDMQDKIASIIADSCSPGILPDIYSVNIEGKLVLVIEVVRGNLKPYFLKSQGKADGIYIRIGATNRPADLDTIAELERQKRHISYDEEICYDTTFEQLDISPLAQRFETIGKALNEDKLRNLKLIKSDNGTDYPTNALMILLGKFSHCTVKCARFKGTTMDVFTDKKEYDGDIFTILESTQSFVLNHINLKAEIKGLYRDESYEIPVVALRESLTNALIHRDYVNQGRDIKVGIYDDIVNIVSPGSLPSNITMEDIFNGRSEARNRVVAHIFKELGLIEQWGSGISRIINACKEQGLPSPKIEEKNDFFDVELIRPRTITDDKKPQFQPESTDAQPELDMGDRRKTGGKPVDKTSAANDYERLRTITNDYERLTKEKQEILLYLLDKIKISRKEAVELIGLKNTKTYEILSELVDEDLIEKHGKGRSTFYTIAKKA